MINTFSCLFIVTSLDPFYKGGKEREKEEDDGSRILRHNDVALENLSLQILPVD